jgi:tetratricopeptide (TPR) repeat protein
VAPLTDSLDARRLIVDRSLAYLDALAQDAAASEDVQLEVVRGYLRLSSILGRSLASAGLGRSREALARTEQAIAVARRAVAARPRSTAARLTLVEALEAGAEAHDSRGNATAAAEAGREALAIARAIVAERPGEAVARVRLATTTRKTGSVLFFGGAKAEGLDLLTRAVALERPLLDAEPDSPERQLGLSAAHHFLGVAASESGDLATAETNLREALRLDERRYAADPARAREDVADDLLQLSQVLARMKRYDEPPGLLARVVALRREAAAAQPKSNILALRVGSALNRLALASLHAGRPEAAVAPGREALGIVSRVWEADQENNHAAREYFLAMTDLGVSLMRTGQASEACALASRAASFAAPRRARWATLDTQFRTLEQLLATCGGSRTGLTSAAR